MPLLHKKSFVRKRPPAGVNANDKIFYCELTNEAFSDYDEYWERLVLCNAMVWTCELTGRPNLTYQEALDCEAKGLKFVSTISSDLKKPMLYLASLTRRGRQSDLSEDVFAHCRDRYFPGEPVEAIVNKHWYDCKVVRIIFPTDAEIAQYEQEMASSDEEIEIEADQDPLKLDQDGSFSKPITLDDDDESNADSDIQVIEEKAPKTPPKKQLSPKKEPKSPSSKKKDEDYPPYATYKYEVEEELAWDYKTCKRHIVSWEKIRRSKNALTRDKCKLLLKICTELSLQGYWTLKNNITRKYNIANTTYQDLFPGNAPKFAETKSKKMPLSMSPRGKEAHERQQKKENRETKLREKKEVREEKRASKGGASTSEEGKKKGRPSLSGQDKLARKIDRQQQALGGGAASAAPPTQAVLELQRAEQQRQMEWNRLQYIEHKERLKQKVEREKAERKQERDIKKEHKKLLTHEIREWLQPRDDLCCGGHKALPPALPVECGIPNQLFGDFLVLLEFINSFSDVLELNDVYSHGISFEMLENAMVTKEVAGVFNDVVQLLLGAVFSLQEEEDEEITADTTVDPSFGVGSSEGGNDQRVAAVLFANRASQWATQRHGTTLHQLPLDALTLTEVLRLHLLSSGADNNTNAQWRHMNRGGYKHSDDPGLQFKLDYPLIVKTLAVKSIFDMHIEEKMKVLQVLVQQILTYAGVRDRLEEAFDKIREVKSSLREHLFSYNKMEKEEHQARILKKKEIRQKTADQIMKKKAAAAAAPAPAGSAETIPAEADEQKQQEEEEPEDEEERKEREEREEKQREKRKQDHNKKELEYIEQIMTLSAKANAMPLGQDRSYRRYWVFNSIPGLFIEDDDPFSGTCNDIATKDIVDVCPDACKETIDRLEQKAKLIVNPEAVKDEIRMAGEDAEVKDVEEKANTSDKENDTSVLGSGPKVNGSFHGSILSGALTPNNVVLPKLVLPAPPISSKPKKLLKASNAVVNGAAKGVKKSDKDQAITNFFTKSPKVVSNVKTEDCDIKPKLNDCDANTAGSVVGDSAAESEKALKFEELEMAIDKEEFIEDEETAMEVEKAPLEVTGLCTADPTSCPVHNMELPRTKWSFYYKEEDINALMESLNDRGQRESELKENLIIYKAKIEQNVKGCPVYILNPAEDAENDTAIRKSKRTGGKKGGDTDTNLNFPIGTSIDHILELTLRDMILEVEEKLYVGVLGRLSAIDREQWRACITGGDEGKAALVAVDVDKLTWAGKTRIARFKNELGLESNITVEEEPEDRNHTVKLMAAALLQVAQSIDVKYLKPPMAETDKMKNKREKSERKLKRIAEKRDRERVREEQEKEKEKSDDSDSDSEAGDAAQLQSVSDNSLRLPLERWEASLMSCISYSQIFLHLATLDNSVIWSRSLTKTRCRVCRKGGDHEKMLLCDDCDKGHHIYCLKPKLKSIPEGDWFCEKCKPKLKAKSPKKNRIIYLEDEVDDDDDEEEEEEMEEAEVEDELDPDGYEDDFCVVCNEGGELLCCDVCPRTYHRECAFLRKVPRGAWKCPECATGAADSPPQEKTKKSNKGSSEEKTKKSDEKSSKKSEEKSKKEANNKKRKSVPDAAVSTQRSSSKRNSPDESMEEAAPSKKRKLDKNITKEMNGDCGTTPNGTSKSVARRTLIESDVLHPGVLHKLLLEIVVHNDSWPFLKPVNKKLVPDYYLLIKKPMDLQTMREKLDGAKYGTDAEFIADGLLVFQNCQQYNMDDTPEYRAGATLTKLFKKRARELGLEVELEEEDDTTTQVKISKAKKTAVKKKRTSL